MSHGARLTNVLSIDVEDYFQVSAFDGTVDRASWPTRESRVLRNTERMLEIFDEADTRATFFVLGWVAERHPDLVRRIAAEGHEVASHGYGHRLVYSQKPDEFAEDLHRARCLLEDAAGEPVLGYRAPSYSVVERSLWALDVLIDQGYIYDSSIYPIHHDRYGIPGWDRHIHQVRRPGGLIWELPGSTIQVGGVNLPTGGGGYFRLLPYSWTRLGIRRLNEVEGHPVVFYLHPWEIDPEQPRLPTSGLTRWRHYANLSRTEARLRRLLSEFQFAPAREVLGTVAQPQRVARLATA